MTIPKLEDLVDKSLDIALAKEIKIEIDRERNVVYVHVDGITLLRATGSARIVLDQKR
jgi:hypothetical protein